MTDTEREQTQDVDEFAWARTMWEPFVDQAFELMERDEAPKDDSSDGVLRRLRALEDERAIEHVFRRYHACYDAGDIERILSCYTTDAIQINARGTYRGHDELRESYRWLTSRQRFVVHYGTNVVVTVDDQDPDRATLNAFWFAGVVNLNDQLRSCGGTYLHQMRRVDGRWLIAAQRITFNYLTEQQMVPRDLSGKIPQAASPLTTRDLVEERYLLA